MLPLAERLADAGYRAVAPYMRGYGPTSRPRDGDYSIPTLGRDVIALIRALGSDPALVVGHDWGAVATYAAANLGADSIERFVAMSVPPPRTIARNLKGRLASRGLRQLRRSWYIAFFQLRLLSDWRLASNDFALVERLWRDWSPGWDYPSDRLAEVKATLASPGSGRAALSYYRAALSPFTAGAANRALLPRFRVPGTVVAGGRDGCIGAELYGGAEAAFLRDGRLEVIDDAGHFLPLEATDEVADIVLDR